MKTSFIVGCCVVVLSLLVLPLQAQQPERKLITIAAGSQHGIYYQVASEVCRLTSAQRQQHGLRCGAIVTEGSSENLALLLAGEVDFALVQSDVLYFAALQNPGAFKAVLATHAEPLTIVTTAGSGIKLGRDLAGKRVNIGAPESGTNASARRLLAAVEWPTPLQLSQDNDEDAFENLCLGELDAFVTIQGHPNALVNSASKRCDIEFVSVLAETFLDEQGKLPPFFSAGTIPGRLYRGNKQATPTLAFAANLVVRADVPDDYVRAVAQAVFAQQQNFATQITAYSNVFRKLEHMTGSALVVPLHPQVQHLLSQP